MTQTTTEILSKETLKLIQQARVIIPELNNMSQGFNDSQFVPGVISEIQKMISTHADYDIKVALGLWY